MLEVPSLAGQPVTLEKCWMFIRRQPELFDEFVYFFLQQLWHQSFKQPPNSEEIEDYLNRFSQVSQLSSAEQFERWLEESGDDYESFMERVRAVIVMEKFRQQIDRDSEIKAKFEQKKHLFDYFLLSRLIFTDQSLAQIICKQTRKNQKLSQEILQTCATSDDVTLRWKEHFIRAELPKELQSLLVSQASLNHLAHCSTNHSANHLIDQSFITNQGWCLVYVHQFIPMMQTIV